jgi:DNA-binding IscR family transcriptional regulator
VRALLADLEEGGIVSQCGGDELDRYQLGRAAEEVTVAQVLEALRGKPGLPGPVRPADAAVREVVAEIEGGVGAALRGRSLADVLAEEPVVDPARRRP